MTLASSKQYGIMNLGQTKLNDLKDMYKKCNKCDDRGMISDSKVEGIYAGHSCECGKNLRRIEKLSGYKYRPKEIELVDVRTDKELSEE